MAFSFGNTSNTFGAAKPTAFGSPLTFGTPAATTASTGFGGFGSSFGTATTQSAPAFGTGFGATATGGGFGAIAPATGFGSPATGAFGGSTFGVPVATSAPFGSTFGAQTAPTFGTAFGTPATSAPAFGTTFGVASSTAPSLFGSTTTKPSLFGTSSTPSLFSTPASSAPLFGNTSTTQAPSLFGAAPPQPNLFGTPVAAPATNLFGGGAFGATSSAPSLFGSTAPSTGAFGLFGSTPATTASAPLFGAFGAAKPNNFGFGSTAGNGIFGNATGGTSLFGAKAPVTTQQPQTQPLGPDQQTLFSFHAINIFGDERDDILKKWNMLQAFWGTGKGFYNANQPPVEYDHCNPYFRFKGISYVVIPQQDNADGFVKLLFNKKESELTAQKNVLIDGLNGILGNKPNLTVNVVHIKMISDNETEFMITVSEKGVTGTSRKIHAVDLATFLNQAHLKQHLTNAGVTFIGPYVTPTKAQLEEYLKEPPPGVDLQMWMAAQMDNPKPDKYLPVPMTGFSSLKKRVLCQEFETSLHKAFLEKVDNDIRELKKKQATTVAQIAEQKQKFMQLQHRVLKILVKQESSRNVGIAMQPKEEMLRTRLDLMNSQLNTPTQYKGKLCELMSVTKVHSYFNPTPKNELYTVDPSAQEDIKQFLGMEQNGIAHLIQIINQDLKNLKIISSGMSEILTATRR